MYERAEGVPAQGPFWREEDGKLIGTQKVFHVTVNLVGNLVFPSSVVRSDWTCFINAGCATAPGQHYLKER